jgi:DTW domain-containing protein YfiP
VSPRAVCDRCLRPAVVCYCAHVAALPTRTRVVLLQHPRESRVGIGTARMAHLCLPNSELHVGLDFAADPAVAAAVAGPAPVYVLFPGPGARDVAELPREPPVTLVVLDGTWWQAGKLLRLNPALAALPRVAFTPRRASNYRIRRQPAAFCVSTIEALVEVLDTLEPGGATFERLLVPFQAMVARQETFATEIRSRRHRHLPLGPSRVELKRAALGARLRALWPRLVCVNGEANAWPRHDPARPEPEIVHWLGYRPATGETYEAILAPRRALAPATSSHVQLADARLRAGVGVEAWRQSWRAFSRPDDVLVTWGTYYRDLARADDLALSTESLDLRREVMPLSRARVRTVEAARAVFAGGGGTNGATASGPPFELDLAGRGGRRLSALIGVLTALAANETAAS